MLGGDSVSIMQAGLPDITGTFGGNQDIIPTGAFKQIQGYQQNSGTDAYANTVEFRASNSNAIYGASNTVQPPSIVLIPQVKY